MTVPNQWFRREFDPTHDISPLQTEFAMAHRVPFLISAYPHYNFVTGIVVENEIWGGVLPTEEEVALVGEILASYQDFFFPRPNHFRVAMEEFAPYDIDGGAVGFYFVKKQDGTWAYRRSTWRDGATFRPSFDERQLSLEEVIERGHLRWMRRTAV